MTELTALEKVTFEVLDKWLKFQTKYGDAPGVQVSIRKKGELIFSNAYGYANIEKKTPYKTSHIGHVASQSKMYTSCIALQLQADGLLNIHDPIIKYMPEFAKHKDKRFKEILVRDLMNNRSGIFRDGFESSFWDLQKPFLSRNEVINEIMENDLVYEPNTHTKYSNIGYALLGILLERASNTDYNTLVETRILKKLPKSKISTDYGLNKDFAYADGHFFQIHGQRKVLKHVPANALASATGFCSNTESASLFLYELYFGDKLLDKHTKRDLVSMNWMVKNSNEAFYGLGMQFYCPKDETYVGHSGGYPGFTSNTRWLVGSDYIFSVICNCNTSDASMMYIAINNLMKKIDSSFTKTELESAIVSDAMFNNWARSIYIVSAKKALHIPLATWSPANDAYTMAKRKDGNYYSDKIFGISSVGEPVKFTINQNQITKVQNASSTQVNEKEFEKSLKKIFAS